MLECAFSAPEQLIAQGSPDVAGLLIELMLTLGSLVMPPGSASAAAEDPRALSNASIEFNRDIRPILSEHCYQCHGPDRNKRKADLRLDQEDSAKASRDGMRAIVAGDLAASEVYHRIKSTDDERMPPVKSGKALSAGQIELIGRWITEGAKWQPHWSFIPPHRPEVPRVKRPRWVRNPIDAFILSRLEHEALEPSPESGRGTLLRRVSFDLTGLPPTRAEIEAFENDPRPDAYERAVDRLLASPRFGERMAYRWLNVARYADTNGYQTDAPRIMWRWRDWVIDAYNRDLPFDRFTIEQLAGDLLPGATLDQRIATGFNRNHRGNAEGGIIPEEYAVEYVVDRVDTTATVWLGLTLACCRCHDHKFDPFSQEDFYSFFAFFNSVPENGRAIKFGNSPPMIKAPTPRQRQQLGALEERLAMLKRKRAKCEPQIAAAQGAWELSLRQRPNIDWFDRDRLVARFSMDGPQSLQPAVLATNSHPVAKTSTARFRDGEPQFAPGAIGSALVFDGRGFLDAGDVARFGFYDRFTLSAWIKPTGTRGGAVISRMADEPQGEGYSLVVDHGKLRLNLVKRWLDDAIRVESAVPIASDRWCHVAVSYDGSRLASGISMYLDGKPVRFTVLLDELNQSFQTKEPLRIGGGGGEEGRFRGLIDGLAIYGKVVAPEDVEVLATKKSIGEIINSLPASSRSSAEMRKVRQCFLATAAPKAARALEVEIIQAQADLESLNERIPTTMVMEELPKPRIAHVLVRGQYDKAGKEVQARVIASLSAPPKGIKPDRLSMARWLVDGRNPLTARVAVNRDWQMLFGAGLVRTVDDFGTQGEPPSHPELLDWLATEFVATGWDEKAMLRLIVTSATYRQSSRCPQQLRVRDPENRLLARGPRLRLTAEMVRDQALHLATLLVERIGGPSVKPYQPPGLWSELTEEDYVQDHGPNLYRRGLYTFWKRTIPPPSLAAFDAPARETCVVRETRTNTPIQALCVLNDVTFIEAARAFGETIMKAQPASPQSRVDALFRAATGRAPKPAEQAILRASLGDQLERFRGDSKAAQALVENGESQPDSTLDRAELAAYTAVAQLILNLDETITKE
jgi:hypothetical protein